MSKFEENKKLAQETGEPVVTAVQKTKEIELTIYQKEILDSIEKMESCDIVISVKKTRTGGGNHVIHMDYNGKRLIPRNSLKN
jgi:hypothetical protein